MTKNINSLIKKGLEIIKKTDKIFSSNTYDLKQLQFKINKYTHFYDLPNNLIFNNIQTHSWFDMLIASNKNFTRKPLIKYDKLESDGFYTKKYKLNLTDIQKCIINRWIDSYTSMYNETIDHINYRFRNKLSFLNINMLKKHMKPIKNKIINQSKMVIKTEKNNKLNYKHVYVNSHILDYAINDANIRLKSCVTNLKKGNIKYFKLRKIKFTKPDRILKIEKLAFKKNSICESVLGKVKCINNEEDFSYLTNMETVSIIKKHKNEYYLLKKYKYEKKENKNNNSIGLDAGVRTFLTGYANKEILEIGNKSNKIIKNKLKQIDKINKKNFKENKKRKKIKKKYERIKNMIKDMHYKISKYITDKYANIIMGNLSTKKMGEGNKIGRMTKRIGNMLSINSFKNVLKYMCNKKGVNYKEVDERYTSKCCGRCGNKKDDLGGNKKYECKKCGIKIGRDINAARIMIIKSEK